MQQAFFIVSLIDTLHDWQPPKCGMTRDPSNLRLMARLSRVARRSILTCARCVTHLSLRVPQA